LTKAAIEKATFDTVSSAYRFLRHPSLNFLAGRDLFRKILSLIDDLRPRPAPA